MIETFTGETADEVWQMAAERFHSRDRVRLQESRAGDTLEILHAGFSISDPTQRWVLSRFPGISPGFAIAEIVWIVRGLQEADFLNFWNPQLPEYAGDVENYHGAYGYRIRRQFGVDQLDRAYKALKHNPENRQVVLQIYDPREDMPNEDGSPTAEDVPCNVSANLKVRDGSLEWTQILRSNDLFLGVPYNFVQFTHIQEILAGWLDLEVGSYNHLSDSLHVYTRNLDSVGQSSPIENPAPNTDSLRFERKESEMYFKGLERRIKTFIREGLSPSKLEETASWPDAPESIQNLLSLLGAEAARRHEEYHLIDPIMSKCSNPALNRLWDQWQARFESRTAA
ncbi:thymidylate synthase [Salinibacter altiplanensis]|uniref:thymidylate synthase n=1 Tax=Salinibacter altiplanensis TaxID=1803181 RepID=UPI000C9F8C3C|nr:thymidylate synthase [Salinibacter altiplanensis]